MAKIKDYLEIAEQPGRNLDLFKDFKKNIFHHTLKWEGGKKLHNVAGDSGGWTIWGLAYNYNKEVFLDFEDFKDTTYDEAAAIAFVRYYVNSYTYILPRESQLMYFDMAYNLGVTRTIKIAQKCAGVTADGLVGPISKRAFRNIKKPCLYSRRVGFYNYLVRKNVRFKKFIKGWLNRAKDINKQK